MFNKMHILPKIASVLTVANVAYCSEQTVPVSSYQGSCGSQGPVNLLYNYSMAFASPNHPNVYNNNQDCSWEFVAPDGKEVLIQFTHFEVRLTVA